MKSDRGAILIQVAVFLLALTAFSAIVVDYGIMWTSRGQAQNAADAGALAAATHLMKNPTSLTDAELIAKKFAAINAIWTVETASTDVLFESGLPCPPGSSGGSNCVRVDVLRGARDRNNLQHTNYLPMIFGSLVGKTTQGVIATAMAEITAGNAVQCIKPWIVADKWTDTTADTDVSPYAGDSWDRDDTWDAGDTYTPTGFNPTFDTGYIMPLKPGVMNTYSSGWAMEIILDCPGGDCYRDQIEGCPTETTVGIWNPTDYATAHPGEDCFGNNETPDPGRGCVEVQTGIQKGPTRGGIDALISRDSGAQWVVGDNPATTGEVETGYVNSPCMTSGSCQSYFGDPPVLKSVAISPRIVPIAIFDTASFINQTCTGGGCRARVINIAGFFIEGMCDQVFGTVPSWCGSVSEAQKVVVGRYMKYPGQGSGSGGPSTSSFVQRVRLVR